MTYPPMRCERCAGERVIEYDRVRNERTETVSVECDHCEGSGIEPDDEDEDDGLLDEGRN